MAENTVRSKRRAELEISLDGLQVEPVSRVRHGKPRSGHNTDEAIQAAMRQLTGPVEQRHQPLNVRRS